MEEHTSSPLIMEREMEEKSTANGTTGDVSVPSLSTGYYHVEHHGVCGGCGRCRCCGSHQYPLYWHYDGYRYYYNVYDNYPYDTTIVLS